MNFTFTHHGAVDGVTGSCHQLTLPDGQAVLVDCGLFQGAETSPDGAGAGRLEINFPLTGVRALIVTHVHIDHVGRTPYLLAAGFKGPIVCSEASAELLPMVIEDALKVGFTRNRTLIQRVINQLRKQIVPLPYKAWLPLGKAGPAAATLKVRLHRPGTSWARPGWRWKWPQGRPKVPPGSAWSSAATWAPRTPRCCPHRSARTPPTWW